MINFFKTFAKLFFSKRMIKFMFWSGVILLLSIWLSNKWIISRSSNSIYTSIEKIPVNNVGLVLGTSEKTTRGTTNLYFKYRMEAAAKLYKRGKIKHLLVSGDNGTKYYDESNAMKSYLIKLGVPANKITLDYAGFRTLDSVVRSKKIFGQEKITIISQEFHNQRAVFIANYYGIDAVAFNAKKVTGKTARKTNLREYLAKFKAVLDLYILHKKPRFLGEEINIPL